MRRVSTALFILGILLAIGGVLALLRPFAASLAVTTMVGLFCLSIGVLQAWLAFRAPAMAGRGLTGVAALMGIVAGVWLLANPTAGSQSLTLLLGVVFFVIGVARLMSVAVLRGSRTVWPTLLAGLMSAGVGLLVFFNIGTGSVALLGILLGIQLLAEGGALFALGLYSRKRGY